MMSCESKEPAIRQEEIKNRKYLMKLNDIY